MLPPSLPSRHFVFHPVDINNMASYDNEKGQFSTEQGCCWLPGVSLYSLVMAQLFTQGQWPGYGFPYMPQYPTLTIPQPRNGSRFVYFTSRTPCVFCTVSIVSIVFMNIFLMEIYIGVWHLGLFESGRLSYWGYCIHIFMGEPR